VGAVRWHHVAVPEGGGAPEQLAGRSRELLVVVAALASRHSLVVIGPGGIGKTALVQTALAAAGVTAVVVRGVELARHVPLLPLRAALGPLPGGTAGEVATAVASRLRGAPLVVEDLHACDPDTLDVLTEVEALAPVVATTRPVPDPPAALVAALRERDAVLELGPLDAEASRALARRLRPGASERELATWTERAGGVPLLLRCLVDMPPAAADVPVELTAFVATLSDDARWALARAAIGGRGIGCSDLGPAADELAGRGLLSVVDGRTVVHELVGEAAVAVLDEAARRRLHCEAADRAETAAEAASHLVAAGDERGHRLAREAADEAPTPASRADLLALAASAPDADHDTVLDAVAAAVDLGRYDEAHRLLQGLPPDARALPDPRVDVLVATCEFFTGRADAARAAIDRGLARDDVVGTAHEVSLLVVDARLRARIEWDLEGAAASARRAVSVATRLGHGEAAAHAVLGTALLVTGDDGALDHLEQAVEQGFAAGDLATAATAADTLFVGRLLTGDAAACLPLAEDLERQPGLPVAWQWQFRKNALLAALHVAGDYERVLDDAPRVVAATTAPRTRSQVEATLVLARADTGDDVGALAAVEQLSALTDSDPTTVAFGRWCVAEAHWLAGRPELAVSSAAPARELPVVGFPAHVLALLAEAWARVDLGSPVDPVLPAPGFRNLTAAQVEHRALRALGRDPRTAEALFLEAARTWLPGPRWRARSLLGAGVAAVDAGRREEGTAHLSEAEALASAAGLQPLLRRVRQELRRASVRRGTRLPPAGSGLTATEEAVLGLVARGMTQPEAARHLAVAPATVRTHLASARRKLGARTAIQAAASLRAAAGADPPRFVVATTPAAFAAERDALAATGPLADLDRGEVLPGPTGDARAVATVRDLDDAARVVALAYRCQRLLVLVDPDAPRLLHAAVVDSLRRLGTVAIRTAATGGHGLADEHRTVLAHLAAGRTVGEVARLLHVSRRTVERRLAAARDELAVSTNVEAVARLMAATRS
jgi:DNA-binding CsgD family transcriptional regulator